MPSPHPAPPAPPAPPEPTPAQWAVRWHGLVVCAALLGAVPLVHGVWHGLLGQHEPLVRTRSQMAAPVPTAAAVLHERPSWMDRKERQLREDSAVVWWLRSSWNEARYRLGIPQSGTVHFGRDEWFFIAGSVAPDRATFVRRQPQRRRFFAEVRDRVRAAGASLFVVVLPDKARVYADRCYDDGVMPPGKRDNYADLLADLAAVGVPTADVAGAMAAARAAQPEVELYYRRDTHWRPQGALVYGRTVAAAIEQHFGSRLPPKVPMALAGVTSVRLVGDLPANMGIGTVELPEPVVGWRTAPMSFLSERLAEQREYYGLEARLPSGAVAMDGKAPDAPVLLVGASFALENGIQALSLFLQRPVRGHLERGESGMQPLRDALRELQAGTTAKVVVWELIERGFFDPAWEDPRV